MRFELCKILQAKGPITSGDLARAAKVDERYLREWLSHQAASNYLSYDAASAEFSLPPEQAMVFANEDDPVYMMGGFDLMEALLDNQPKVQAAFKSGGGVAWGEQAGCMFCAVARFFRPGYHNNLVSRMVACVGRRGHRKAREGRRVSPTSAVAMAGPRWRWPKRSRNRNSSATISIPTRFATQQRMPTLTECRQNARFEVGLAKDYPGKRLRPRHLLRLPARHGRSRRSGRTHAAIAKG